MAKMIKATEAHWIMSRSASDATETPVYAVAHARATVRGDSTVDADLKSLEDKVNGSGRFTVTTAMVNDDAWQETDGGVMAIIPVEGATSVTMPLIFVIPDYLETAIQCGFGYRCTAADGIVTVYAHSVPAGLIEIIILAMFSQVVETNVEVSEPSVPVVAYYKLPVATKDTLGGVKIGRNIDVAEDGTISATPGSCSHVLSGGIAEHVHNEECMKGLVATSDEVNDALNRALGIDSDPEPEPSEPTP